MDIQFKKSGGRLFRIAFIFTVVCIVAVIIDSYFISRAMKDLKELSLSPEGLRALPQAAAFYIRVIDTFNIGIIIGSLSNVLIVIAARYGLRETAQNIATGIAGRQISVPTGNSENVTPEGG
jgi:hypothetical protein